MIRIRYCMPMHRHDSSKHLPEAGNSSSCLSNRPFSFVSVLLNRHLKPTNVFCAIPNQANSLESSISSPERTVAAFRQDVPHLYELYECTVKALNCTSSITCTPVSYLPSCCCSGGHTVGTGFRSYCRAARQNGNHRGRPAHRSPHTRACGRNGGLVSSRRSGHSRSQHTHK